MLICAISLPGNGNAHSLCCYSVRALLSTERLNLLAQAQWSSRLVQYLLSRVKAVFAININFGVFMQTV
uniref:Uncharacterized protein n=1 Tax=Anguilla anguilla TaxID=7936 RepID=A0A0E9TWF0_ANGAN